MAQEHGDRLTAVDASFLAQEGPTAHMHVGAVLIFEGPAPAFDDFADHIRGRLHLVPRYRQKLAFPPLETGRPLWVDDPSFNLEYHVRHTALPAPGSEEQLRALAARIHSQALDRSKPLWEMWLVQGLEGGRFALISKTHHALVDGISGVDLMTVLFDLGRDPAARARTRASRGRRGPTPSALDIAGARAARRSRACRSSRGRARVAAAAPSARTRWTATREALEGARRGRAGRGSNPAPGTPLNVEIGPHRRLVVRARRARGLQARQGRARRHRQRRRARRRRRRAAEAGCARAACAPRGSSCARSCPVSIRATRRAPPARQPDRRDARRRCRSTSRTRSRGCSVVRQAMDGLKESKQARRRRGARRACRRSRRRRSSPRRRG